MLNSQKAMRIGIMGGTFDPVHFGHLVTAESARSEFLLDKVIFVPSGQPPHKKGQSVTDAKHRYLMTILAVTANPSFEVSSTEIDRKGYSYTIDTVLNFKKEYGEAAEFYFITGADAVLEVLTWKDINQLIKLCSFVAATRPGFDLASLDKKVDQISPMAKKRFLRFDVPALSISSTDIRNRVAKEKSIKYLLPEEVEQYIYKNNLYKE